MSPGRRRAALATPRLAIRSFSAEPIAENLWRVRLVVENTGWLPTNGSQQAVDQQVVGDVVAELTLPAGAHLADGEPRRPLGQLEGRSTQRSTATWWGYSPGTPDRAVADWVVAAPTGTILSTKVSSDRAGSARGELVLRGDRR